MGEAYIIEGTKDKEAAWFCLQMEHDKIMESIEVSIKNGYKFRSNLMMEDSDG